jgi:hypothetical protein
MHSKPYKINVIKVLYKLVWKKKLDLQFCISTQYTVMFRHDIHIYYRRSL